ncbi:MAG: NAD(P)H-dependent oxidoreductase [Gemmatimonadota bacterium]|nr:NAD(P)H-dependent oxidoreductase [Gemmatimonadota bacterium]
MARVLILFAHPALERSRVHKGLLRALPTSPDLTLHDLYEAYPRLDIDVEREQQLLVDHDVIAFQHPFYWYSTPPILKQWQDLVLEHGWAYGSEGNELAGKTFIPLLSAGGGEPAYCSQGYNRFSVRELLAPVEQTARLCGMHFLPPFVVFGTHQLDAEGITEQAGRYRRLLEALLAGEPDEAERERLAGAITINGFVSRLASVES